MARGDCPRAKKVTQTKGRASVQPRDPSRDASILSPKTTPLFSQIYSLDPFHLDILVRANSDIHCQRRPCSRSELWVPASFVRFPKSTSISSNQTPICPSRRPFCPCTPIRCCLPSCSLLSSMYCELDNRERVTALESRLHEQKSLISADQDAHIP